jgi:hypothetical protein
LKFTKAKLTSLQQVQIFNVPLHCVENTLLENVPIMDKNLIGLGFVATGGPCLVWVTLLLLLPSKAGESGTASNG